jgi:hypothetical protein
VTRIQKVVKASNARHRRSIQVSLNVGKIVVDEQCMCSDCQSINRSASMNMLDIATLWQRQLIRARIEDDVASIQPENNYTYL